MRITKNIFLGDNSKPLTTSEGVRLLRKKLKLNTTALGIKTGVSKRTVEGWEQGRPPSEKAMMAMKILLKK